DRRARDRLARPCRRRDERERFDRAYFPSADDQGVRAGLAGERRWPWTRAVTADGCPAASRKGRLVAKRPIDALVIGAAAHRQEIAAEGNRARCRALGILVGWTLPAFDQRHMIGPIGLNQDVEAQIGILMPGALDQLLDRSAALIQRRGYDVDMRHHHDWRR